MSRSAVGVRERELKVVAIPTCPENQGWPETNINTNREIPCGVGIEGMQTRYCYNNQTWGPIQDEACGTAWREEVMCSAVVVRSRQRMGPNPSWIYCVEALRSGLWVYSSRVFGYGRVGSSEHELLLCVLKRVCKF